MTLKVTFAVGTFLSLIPREIQHVLSTVCLHMNQKVHVGCKCNFNCLLENEGLQGHYQSRTCKCGNTSESVPDRVVVASEVIYGLSNRGSFSHLELPASFLKVIFHTAVQQLTKFQLTVHLMVSLQ